MPKKDTSQGAYVCCQCNEHFNSLTQFYKTYSGLYSGTGYLPICKQCFAKLFNSYVEKYGDNRKAMQRICMAFDLYYDDSIFDTCNDGTDAFIGNYIKRLNMVQYKGKTFDTALDKGFEFNNLDKKKAISKSNEDNEEVEEIDPKDIEKWGVGFENVDYDTLNAHYKYLKTANPNCDSNQEIFVIDLCYINMQKMKALRNGDVDAYNKLTESYRKSFNQAGLKTVDTMKTDDDCWSVWVDRVSQYTPEEFYKNKERYKDHDGFGEYYERFAIRPLKNIVLGTQNRDNEFFVHSEEE